MKQSTDFNDAAILAHWTDMCRYYSFIGDKQIEPFCYSALNDERRINDLERMAGLPTSPAESRVCDSAFRSLLLLKQVDVEQVFLEYGSRKITTENWRTETPKVYEAAIKDIANIKKKYFDE